LGASAASGFLRGLPGEGESLMDSIALRGYKALRQIIFTPALRSLFSAVHSSISKALAISVIVNPSIFLLSAGISINFRKFGTLLNECVVNFESFYKYSVNSEIIY
jgi:hypothetical protein